METEGERRGGIFFEETEGERGDRRERNHAGEREKWILKPNRKQKKKREPKQGEGRGERERTEHLEQPQRRRPEPPSTSHATSAPPATRAEHFRFGPVLVQNKQPNRFYFIFSFETEPKTGSNRLISVRFGLVFSPSKPVQTKIFILASIFQKINSNFRFVLLVQKLNPAKNTQNKRIWL